MSKSNSTESIKSVTKKAVSNYYIAFADTLSAQSLASLRSMAQKNRNPALVSEIRNGLGDTSDNTCSESGNLKTISLDFPTGVSIKTISAANLRKTCGRFKHNRSQSRFNSKSATSRNPHHSSKPGNDDPVPTPTPIALGIVPTTSISQSSEIIPRLEQTNITTTINNCPDDQCCEQSRTHAAISFNDSECQDTVIQAPFPQKRPSCEIDIGAVVAGRYEILSEISRGGHGIVYRARQLGIDRIVALKRLHSQNDKSITQRFLLEANIIRDLIHPNTIQLIDAGNDNNHLYIVMEYIEGQSLRDLLIQEKSLDILRTINIARQILKSLNEAHQRGIIHRDIKPSNIIIRSVIGENDFVKVLDFGIAKARYQNMPHLTQNGKLLGTPQYLAPELLFGDIATPAVDLFAIGLLLVEMLSGHSPLPKDAVEVVKLATSPDPIEIPEWIKQTEIGPVIQCALQKDPKQRYHSATEMLADLQRVEMRIHMHIHNKSPLTASRRLNRQDRYTKIKLALAAMVFILAANAFVYYLFL